MLDAVLIPWRRDFISSFGRFLLDEHPRAAQSGDFSEILCVFPSRAPIRHVTSFLTHADELTKPCILPRMLQVGELFSHLRALMLERPSKTVGALDQVGLLHQCVQDVQFASEGLLENLPVEDPQLFFPWGLRLAALFEDFYRHGGSARDIPFQEDAVLPFAAALLEQLGLIQDKYEQSLVERDWSTLARDAWFVSRHSAQAMEAIHERRIYLVGFDALTGVEETLFQTMWRAGAAQLILHGDPLLTQTPGTSAHWSCSGHIELLQRWGCPARVLDLGEPVKDARPAPAVDFVEGFDLHSQLDALQHALRELPTTERAVVVLPEADMLPATLRHLPAPELNVSMGYPLLRSPLARLVEILLTLQENSASESNASPRRYYWRDAIEFVRHPYVKLLCQNTALKSENAANSILHDLEAWVRDGEKFTDLTGWRPVDWTMYADPENAGALEQAFCETMESCVEAFTAISTLSELTAALTRLCTLLIERGGEVWDQSNRLIDAECLHRMLYHVIPSLADNSLSETRFSRDVLFMLLRELIAGERVPFESEQAEGLQLLSLQETRLLRFDHVFILQAMEDAIPGAPSYDPLFPDELRKMMGLPDSFSRERAAACAFFSLVRGAERATLYYESGVGGELDKQGVRSRFVEELLWEEEQRQGKVLASGSPPMHAVSYPIHPIPKPLRVIEKSGAVQDRIESYLKRPVSASALDAYMACPQRFYLERVIGLRPLKEVAEEGDRAELGSAVHEALRAFFAPRVGALYAYADGDEDELSHHFTRQIEGAPWFVSLSYDKKILIRKSGSMRLKQYLQRMPETTVLSQEKAFNASFSSAGREFGLFGRFDRVDQRPQGVVILDYKTGKGAKPPLRLWEDEDLFARLENWPESDPEHSILPELAQRVQSVQLPCYAYLYAEQENTPPYDAALIELGRESKEAALFGVKVDEEVRTRIVTELAPRLIGFLTRHLLESQSLAPHPGRRCQWCPFVLSCARG